MKMDRAKKQAFVEDLAGKLAGAEAVYLTDFSGLDVERITLLRYRLRASSVDYVVVKNTLARRAITGTAAEPLKGLLEGPTAFAVSRGDVVSAAKALTDFAKDTNLPRIKGGVVAGRILGLEEIRRLAALPSRDALLGRVLGSMQSPVTGFVYVLAGILGKFVRTLDAVRAQRAEGGAAAADAAGGRASDAAAEATLVPPAEATPAPPAEATPVPPAEATPVPPAEATPVPPAEKAPEAGGPGTP